MGKECSRLYFKDIVIYGFSPSAFGRKANIALQHKFRWPCGLVPLNPFLTPSRIEEDTNQTQEVYPKYNALHYNIV